MKATSEGEKGSKATSDNERKKGKKETGKKEKAAMFVQSFIVSLSLSSSQSLSLSSFHFGARFFFPLCIISDKNNEIPGWSCQ